MQIFSYAEIEQVDSDLVERVEAQTENKEGKKIHGSAVGGRGIFRFFMLVMASEAE